MLIVTTDLMPGYEIRALLGDVYGVAVHSENLDAGHSTSFRVSSTGEVPGQAGMLPARKEAVARMAAEAQRRGANAVVGLRFDNGPLPGQGTEVCSYGTAVWAEPVSELAKQQQESLQRATPPPPSSQPDPARSAGHMMTAKDVTMGVRDQRGDHHS